MVASCHTFVATLATTFITLTLLHSCEAWAWSNAQDEIGNILEVDNLEDTEGATSIKGNTNSELDGDALEEEDVENEQNLRCSQHFNRNLYRILKSMMPGNATDRISRQDDSNTDPNDLVQSMLNLEFSQIIGPVLKIVSSAAASNATAIDENYNSLPLAVRYQVNDFIKFTVDLLTTT